MKTRTPLDRARDLIDAGWITNAQLERMIADAIEDACVDARRAGETYIAHRAYAACVTRGHALEGRSAQVALELGKQIKALSPNQ